MDDELMLERWSAYIEANDQESAIEFVKECAKNNPDNGMPGLLLGGTLQDLERFEEARDAYFEGMSRECSGEGRLFVVESCASRLVVVDTKLGNYTSALRIFNFAFLPEEQPLSNQLIEAVFTSCFETKGFESIDAAGRNLLHYIRKYPGEDPAAAEYMAALVYSLMAKYQISDTKGEDGHYRNLDRSMAGANRLRRYCGVAWSYNKIVNGDNAGDNKGLILMINVLIPWRVVNGRLDGEPIDIHPDHLVDELNAKGIFGLEEAVNAPPEAPWVFPPLLGGYSIDELV